MTPDRAPDEGGVAKFTYSDDGCAIIGLDPEDDRESLLSILAMLARSRLVSLNVTDLLTSLTAAMKEEQIETAFVWAQTERWRADRDELGRSLDPRGN